MQAEDKFLWHRPIQTELNEPIFCLTWSDSVSFLLSNSIADSNFCNYAPRPVHFVSPWSLVHELKCWCFMMLFSSMDRHCSIYATAMGVECPSVRAMALLTFQLVYKKGDINSLEWLQFWPQVFFHNFFWFRLVGMKKCKMYVIFLDNLERVSYDVNMWCKISSQKNSFLFLCFFREIDGDEIFKGGHLVWSLSYILPQNTLKIGNFLMEDQRFWHELPYIIFIKFLFLSC